MGLIVLFAFILIPLIEIGLFIQVGGFIGLWPTIAVVILTAMAGTTLLRLQGLSALNRLQTSLQSGEQPLAPVFDGFCLLVAGILLLTPGFFTDTIGFLLFIPPLRHKLRTILSKFIQVQNPHNPFEPNSNQSPNTTSDPIIDGDWQDVTPTDPTKNLPKNNNKLD